MAPLKADDIFGDVFYKPLNVENNVGGIGSLFFDMFNSPERYVMDSEEDYEEIDDRVRCLPSEWVQKYINIKDTRMSFAKYPYQKAIIDDMHPKQVISKAAQLGVSQIMLAKVFWFGDYGVAGSSGKIIYTFPTFNDMSTYASARIPPIIDDSTPICEDDFGFNMRHQMSQTPYIRSMMVGNNAQLKRIRNTFFFLKGTTGENTAISVDSDWNIHDEVNFSNQNVLNKYRSRLGAASSLGWEYMFSTPTIPGYGVSKEFQKSDQKYWYIKCPKCGGSYRLNFERNVKELAYGKGYIYQCHKCSSEIKDSTRARGFYIAEQPGMTDISGYHIDKMCNPNLSANALMKSKEEYKRTSDFHNFDLGEDYSEKSITLDRATLELLYDTCVKYKMSAYAKVEDLVTMGIDQGDTLWVEISGTDRETGKRKMLYAEKVDSTDFDDEDAFQRIPELIERYKVQLVVIDALPNKNSAKWLRNKYRDAPDSQTQVYMAYYTSTRDGDYNYNEETRIVNIDRTETFKACYNKIYIGEYAIPIGSEIIELWIEHMCNLKKATEEDEETGDIKEAFVRTGPDHFNHAHLYCEVAYQILLELVATKSQSVPSGIAMQGNKHWKSRPGFAKTMDSMAKSNGRVGGVGVVPRRKR